MSAEDSYKEKGVVRGHKESLVSVMAAMPRLGTNRERRFMGHSKHGRKQLENNAGLVEFIRKERED